MAKIPLTKVRFAGLAKHRDSLVLGLQQKGLVHFNAQETAESAGKQMTEAPVGENVLLKEQLEYFISELAPLEPEATKPKMMQGGKVISRESEIFTVAEDFGRDFPQYFEELSQLSEGDVRRRNEIEQLQVTHKYFEGLSALEAPYLSDDGVRSVVTKYFVFTQKGLESFKAAASAASPAFDAAVVGKVGDNITVRVTAHTSQQEQIFALADQSSSAPFLLNDAYKHYGGKYVTSVLTEIEDQISHYEHELTESGRARAKLAEQVRPARMYADTLDWSLGREAAGQKLNSFDRSFTFTGWTPERSLSDLKSWVQDAFGGGVAVEEVAVTEEEVHPVLLENMMGVDSFETMTGMYGMPAKDDIDPTPFMAPFFVLFFGVCLSDVGYGTLLVLTALYFMIRGDFDEDIKKVLRMVLMCGVAAIIGGVLLGGYFGIEASAVPSYLTYETPDGPMFKGQLVNPIQGNGTLIFLGASFGLGIMQLLFSLVVDAYKRVRNGDLLGAVLDSGAWFFFVLMLTLFGTAGLTGLDQGLMGTLAAVGAGVLILTQGRDMAPFFLDQENPIMKVVLFPAYLIGYVFKGFIGLFGIMGYVSDMLSYARLMALGLATGVIGFSMNTTAGVIFDLVGVPGLAHIAAAIVILFGHSINFGLSALGAGIHSMRLQFIEFFGHFYTGGGGSI